MQTNHNGKEAKIDLSQNPLFVNMFADWFCGNIRIFFRVHSVIIIRISRNAFRLFGNKRGDDRGQIINRKGSTKLWKDRLKPYNLTFKELLRSLSGRGSDLASSKREPMSISLLHSENQSEPRGTANESKLGFAFGPMLFSAVERPGSWSNQDFFTTRFHGAGSFRSCSTLRPGLFISPSG